MSFEYGQFRRMRERNETGEEFVEKELLVPDKMVGKIIGLCGEEIHRLQTESGCKIQMDSKNIEAFHRTCTLTGSRQSVNNAKSMIEEILRKHSNNQLEHEYAPDGEIVRYMMIPVLKVALLIGKEGDKIKQLQEQCGVRMEIIQNESELCDKPLRITGDPKKVEVAEQTIKKFLAHNETFSVPLDKCGLVIGKDGRRIQDIYQKTGARVEKAREIPSYPNEQTFIIRGSPEQIEDAKEIIREIVDPNQWRRYFYWAIFFFFLWMWVD